MSWVKRSSPGKFTLRVINSSLIHTYNEKCFELDLGLRRTYTHIFIVADVGCAILGADFLENLGLVVDLHGRYLRDQETLLKVSGGVKAGTFLHPTVAQASEEGVVNKLIE